MYAQYHVQRAARATTVGAASGQDGTCEGQEYDDDGDVIGATHDSEPSPS